MSLRGLLSAGLGTLLVSAPPAWGQTHHARYHLWGSGSGAPSIYFNVTGTGVNSVAPPPFFGSGSGNGTQTADAAVEINPISNSLMRFAAESSGTLSGQSVPAGTARAIAGYRDIITLSGTSPLPSHVRINFELEGELTVTSSALNPHTNLRAIIAALFTFYADQTNYLPDTNTSLHVSLIEKGNGIGGLPSGFHVVGFDSFQGDATSFRATYHFDAPYDSVLGGFAYNLSTGATTIAADGEASASSWYTTGLASVTRVDGSPLNDFTLNFASGMQLTAVPEPATLGLISLCLTGAGTVWWHRCRDRQLAAARRQ